MNFIKLISVLLLPIVAFSYSYFVFSNGSFDAFNIDFSSPIKEEIITKIATTLLSSMSVDATVSSVFIDNRTNTLILDLTFPATEQMQPLQEFYVFYSLVHTLFYDFPSINYIRFVKPEFIKYISTKHSITRDEIKYENE